MKKISYLFAVCLLVSVLIISCSKSNIEPNPIVETVELDNPINNFVWKGMNSWYNWQLNVPNLSDTNDDNLDTYYTYLNGYSDPEDLFNSLRFDFENTDRNSLFIDDYIDHNKQLQGISLTTGIRRSVPIGIGNNQVIIYVQHVSVNSPADIAGIKRGDIINAIDGDIINDTNYASVINKLYNGQTIIISTANEKGGTLTKLNDFTITPVEVSDNPVHLMKVFNNIEGKKVGYLVYNGFRSSFNDELNAAFASFKNEGIDELILDLRINGGGSVQTSAYLASMIYQNAGTDTFAELRFNSKHSNENGSYDFQNTLNIFDSSYTKIGEESINRLNSIDKLYVLASGSTASASEMIINGLRAYMDVIIIGTTTYGKNVGSITLYDSPSSQYINKETANSSHKNAMQPIVFQIFNKLGQSEYTHGFEPNIEVTEWHSWNNILPFGDENEVVLKTALDAIRGLSSKSINALKFNNLTVFAIPHLENKFEKEMYIGSSYFNK